MDAKPLPLEDDAGRRDAESRRPFPYAKYFSDVNLAPQMLLSDVPWLSKIPRDPEPRETVL
ncbi:MAG: hypothetical protein ACREIP_05940, partial [Alphaproteobacteria bacterium]